MAPTSLFFPSFMIQLCITYLLNKTHFKLVENTMHYCILNWAPKENSAFPLGVLLLCRALACHSAAQGWG